MEENIPQILVDNELAKDLTWAKALIKYGLITLNKEVVYEEEIEMKVGDKLEKIGSILKVGRKWIKVINTESGL